MRKSTLLWLVLAAFCGAALFHTSQKVHDEREKMAGLEADIAKEEDSIRVLNTEWSYLNQPARLEKLAQSHLNMAPLKATQFIRVEDIPLRAAAPAVTAAAEQAAPAEKKIEPPRPHIIAAAKPAVKTAVKIIKPAAPAFLQKPAHKQPADVPATATNGRNFSDLMKNLHQGIE